MTSTESAEQNEYEESFKRFKTLFIVGAACFCVGVTVVILGNRFQLYEVQRLGIIFSSFGIGWIVLAVSYLVYMKWCFIPGESENTPQQVVERSVANGRSIVSRTLGRPPSSSEVAETPPPTHERTPGRHSSPAGRNFGRSTSLVSNLQKISTPTSGLERRPLSRNLERRSYSVRNSRDRSYVKDYKRPTSFKIFENPLLWGSSFEKRMPFVGDNGAPLESNCNKVSSLPGKAESSSHATRTPTEGSSDRTTFPEKDYKLFSTSSRNSERPSTFVKHAKRQPLLVQSPNDQILSVKNSEPQPSFEEQPTLVKSETQTAQMKNCERPSAALEKFFERQPSLAKSFERQSVIENCNTQSVPVKHSCSCTTRKYGNPLPQEQNSGRLPSGRNDSDASQTCKIGIDTKLRRSSPPDYYEVVLSLHKDNE